MLKIYDVETARQGILKRQPMSLMAFPAAVQARTEALFGAGVTPQMAVTQILRSVQQEGDAALRRWSLLLDRAVVDDFKIPSGALRAAWAQTEPALQEALRLAAGRIRQFHALQPLPNWQTEQMGGRLGQRVTAVEKVGVYVPGGTAPLPSSLLMAVIPAQVAGVSRIVVCTPPNPSPAVLAAAHLCGVNEVFQVGGAQAVAALAFGTESIPRVDKIVGAGNLFVTLAKQQVYGLVGLDGLAGPTETAVIADDSANPAWVAADLLAQAEHDLLASAILFTPSSDLAGAVQAAVMEQLSGLGRADIIRQSLENASGIVLTPDLDTAAALASDYAPEHLCFAVRNPQKVAERVRNAGGFFLGEGSFEVLGDYVAGPSHVMPTGGTARFASPLNVMDFVKITSLVALDPATSRVLSAAAVRIAAVEQLSGHAAAARFRAEGI
ncbi:MAG TPA: histidinol dehydrogenase [Anaerolineaceae bacterium]|nr:histidinol dehydrogenase [Anaerolineaceae bacterium]HPN51928.1 histidinol dehydrogenase [Anaerolineaceae bacterium]